MAVTSSRICLREKKLGLWGFKVSSIRDENVENVRDDRGHRLGAKYKKHLRMHSDIIKGDKRMRTSCCENSNFFFAGSLCFGQNGQKPEMRKWLSTFYTVKYTHIGIRALTSSSRILNRSRSKSYIFESTYLLASFLFMTRSMTDREVRATTSKSLGESKLRCVAVDNGISSS